MSLADASRLTSTIQTGLKFHQANAFASNICGDLARWALERNCVHGSLGDFHTSHPHQHQPQSLFTSSNSQQATITTTSNLNNVTTAFAQPHQQHQGEPFHVGHQLLHGHNNVSADPMLDDAPLSKLVTNYFLEPMHQLESKLDYYSTDIWLTSGDERTNKLPLIGAGPWKIIYATTIYLCLIKWLLPKVMQQFRPLELNWLIRLYNLLMVVSNIWVFYHGARILNFGLKCFGCETINHQDYSAQAIELLHYGWLFFFSRLVEWLDTIFFVLRKKERQVTKLHVFHHSFVPLLSWIYLKYHPGYTMAFFPFINTFVHSIMYTYYFLATFGSKIQPYLWWKRYLTSLQIVQFVLLIIQLASVPLTGDETCQYPRGFLVAAFAGATLFLWLFYSYYLETYTRTKHQQRTHVTDKQAPESHNKTTICDRGTTTGIKNNNHNNNKAKRNYSSSLSSGLLCGNTSNGAVREGSSRSLSDAIDNAIGCDESPSNTNVTKAGFSKVKSN